MKKTPLYDCHLERGARMVDFAGWAMPVQYEGVIEEHLHVRQHVGLFDVSHMGEIFFRGPGSLPDLQWLTSNDVSKLNAGEAQYSLLLNPEGGIVDDIIVYCIEVGQEYLMCVNAANTDKDYQWILGHSRGGDIKNESSSWAQIAVQGPKALDLVSRILGPSVRDISAFKFRPFTESGSKWYVARTGYTGEEGFEVFLPPKDAPSFWNQLLDGKTGFNAKPIGLGARDTLRVEMKYTLYGNEITDVTSALEAGLGWVVKFNKDDFIGRAPLKSQKEQGIKRKLVGFKMLDKGIPRHDYPLRSVDNQEIGRVTSGTMSPSLKEGIGIGYVPLEYSDIGKEIYVEIRGRHAKARVVKTPFVETSLRQT